MPRKMSTAPDLHRSAQVFDKMTLATSGALCGHFYLFSLARHAKICSVAYFKNHEGFL